VNLILDFWDKEAPQEDSREEAVEVSFIANDSARAGRVELDAAAGRHPIVLRPWPE
jgi:hypothetical protein